MNRTYVLDFEVGRRLAATTMGIDALERAGAGSGVLDSEGLVPIYLGEHIARAESFRDWNAVLARLEELADDIAPFEPGPRKTFLSAMVRSLRAAARLFAGEALSFQEKLTDLVGVPAEPVPDETIEKIHERLDGLLTARGYGTGVLAERVRAWQRASILHRDAIPDVFEELMVVAKARTEAMIFATGNFMMALRPVRGLPYTARCAFNDGCMDINLDVAFTRSSLKHLVCHEVFPGHATQLLYTRALVERGESPAALLCTANAVSGCVQEGIGDQGIELIDWVEDSDEATHIELRRLQTAAGTNAAWHVMISGWPLERAAARTCMTRRSRRTLGSRAGSRWRSTPFGVRSSRRTGSATKPSERCVSGRAQRHARPSSPTSTSACTRRHRSRCSRPKAERESFLSLQSYRITSSISQVTEVGVLIVSFVVSKAVAISRRRLRGYGRRHLLEPATQDIVHTFEAPFDKTAILLLRPTLEVVEGGEMIAALLSGSRQPGPFRYDGRCLFGQRECSFGH